MALSEALIRRPAIPQASQQQHKDVNLVAAAGEGNVEAVRTCLKNGADINQTYEVREPVFGDLGQCQNGCCDGGRPKVFLTWPPRDQEGYTALTFAARNGHYDVAQALIEAGADLNAKEKKVRTHVVKLSLLSAGVLSLPRLIQLMTARSPPQLHFALRRRRASPQQWGRTALYIAVSEGKVDVAELLIKAGANLDAVESVRPAC